MSHKAESPVHKISYLTNKHERIERVSYVYIYMILTWGKMVYIHHNQLHRGIHYVGAWKYLKYPDPTYTLILIIYFYVGQHSSVHSFYWQMVLRYKKICTKNLGIISRFALFKIKDSVTLNKIPVKRISKI